MTTDYFIKQEEMRIVCRLMVFALRSDEITPKEREEGRAVLRRLNFAEANRKVEEKHRV